MKRLATENPVVVVPVVVEPVPVPDPALGVLVPVDIVDVLGVVGVPPKVCNKPSMPPPIEYSISVIDQNYCSL